MTMRNVILPFVLLVISLVVDPTLAQQPKDVSPAPVPAQIVSAKKVFISNGGGEEADPRSFGFPDVNPDRPYNQFYAALRNSGKYEVVPAPVDADLVLDIRFTHLLILTADINRPRYDPVLRLRILDPKSGTLLWAFSERVATPGGPHANEKRESAFDQALTALFDDFGKLASTHGSEHR